MGKRDIWSWPVDPKTRQVHIPESDIRDLRRIVHSHRIVFHNAKFDVRALIAINVIETIEEIAWEDTLLMSHIANSGESHKLKDLAFKYYNFSPEDERLLDKYTVQARKIAKKLGWPIHPDVPADRWMVRNVAELVSNYRNRLGAMSNLMGDLPQVLPQQWIQALEEYAINDAARTILLWMMYSANFTPNQWKCYAREKELLPHVITMEDAGISLIRTKLVKELTRYEKLATKYESEAVKISGNPDLNIRSYPQMSKQLFEKFSLPPLNGGSTDAPTLKRLQSYVKENRNYATWDTRAEKFIDSILLYRQQNTSRNYLKSYLLEKYEDRYGYWWLFPSFNQTGTRTTRFSSSRPNAQNVGKGKERLDEEGNIIETDFKLRSVFGPAVGRIWYTLDYDQLQLRIFAFASQEQSMIDAFKAGWDFHNYVASRLFNTPTPTKLQRRIAKNVNFALIFGGGESKVDHTAGMVGAYQLFVTQFPGAAAYMDSVVSSVRRKGYVSTMFGYPLQVDMDTAYAGTNYIVQGTEGDIVKNAMIKISRYLQTEWSGIVKLIAVIHDEFILDFPRSLPEHVVRKILCKVKQFMEESGREIGVVCKANCDQIDNNWSESIAVAL